jgi:hypothetical protein
MSTASRPFHILGICGSLRRQSFNLMALKAAGELMPEGMQPVCSRMRRRMAERSRIVAGRLPAARQGVEVQPAARLEPPVHGLLRLVDAAGQLRPVDVPARQFGAKILRALLVSAGLLLLPVMVMAVPPANKVIAPTLTA